MAMDADPTDAWDTHHEQHLREEAQQQDPGTE